MTNQPSATESPDRVLLTDRECASRYSVHQTTIVKWARTGLMPPGKRIGGALRWKVSDLEEWEASDFAARLFQQEQGTSR